METRVEQFPETQRCPAHLTIQSSTALDADRHSTVLETSRVLSLKLPAHPLSSRSLRAEPVSGTRPNGRIRRRKYLGFSIVTNFSPICCDLLLSLGQNHL